MQTDTTTLAQLLFTRAPDVDLAALVADLGTALADCPGQRHALTWDHDDMAIFDLAGSRIILAHAADLEGDYAACLTVSVGEGPDGKVPDTIARRQAVHCRLIADRIGSRYPAARVVWQGSPSVATAALVDTLVDTLAATLAVKKETPAPAPAPRPTPRPAPQHVPASVIEWVVQRGRAALAQALTGGALPA